MKATGIIRRTDELGRIVIPKEIRRSMGIRDGEPMEIYTEGENTVCFRKYEVSLPQEVNRLWETIQEKLDADDDTLRKIYPLIRQLEKIVKSKD